MLSGKKCDYEPGEWIDFVRNFVHSTSRVKMQAHLDTGCEQCRGLVKFFSDVVRRAAADAAYTVPDYAVRNIRAIYALQRPEEVRLLPRTVARLVYDSFQQPL